MTAELTTIKSTLPQPTLGPIICKPSSAGRSLVIFRKYTISSQLARYRYRLRLLVGVTTLLFASRSPRPACAGAPAGTSTAHLARGPSAAGRPGGAAHPSRGSSVDRSRGMKAIPLYPEGRPCSAHVADRAPAAFELMADDRLDAVVIFREREGEEVERSAPELTAQQAELLRLAAVSKQSYTS